MATQIRQFQSDASYASQNYSTTNLFASFNGFASIPQGDTLVAFIAARTSDISAAHVVDVMDNCGNSWDQVPGAAVTITANGQTVMLDVWIAKNVAGCGNALPAFILSFALDETTDALGAAVFDFVGAVNAASAGGVSSATPPASLSGPSLVAGNLSAAFLAMAIANANYGVPPVIPASWSDDTDVANFGHQVCATFGHYLGSGTQQPAFGIYQNENELAAITGVAISDGTTVSSGEPFTRDDCEPGDGITVRFLRDCFEGQAGDVKKLSASVARERVVKGDAEFVY